MSDLLPVVDAQRRVLSLAESLETETVDIAQAAGRWLSENVTSKRTQPAADLSAMDGYAIRYAELPGPFTVIGESAAGSPFDAAISPGEAARIFTGAPVPKGVDTVMLQEEAVRDGDQLRLDGEGPSGVGANIRVKGRDYTQDDILLRTGERLTAPRLALAISAGHGSVSVRRKPTVAILSTGDELVEAGQPTTDAQIPASNGPMMLAELAKWPVELIDCGIIRDTEEALGAAIESVRHAEIIVTIGGASVGDYDLVQPVLKAAGAKLDFWRVAMKPGKPVMAGKLGKAVTLGLPGNPSSAFVSAKLFLEPLIAYLSGSADPLPRFASATLAADLPAIGKREEFVRGRWENGAVIPLSQQSSAALVALADAEFLIRRPADADAAKVGDTVDILSLA